MIQANDDGAVNEDSFWSSSSCGNVSLLYNNEYKENPDNYAKQALKDSQYKLLSPKSQRIRIMLKKLRK